MNISQSMQNVFSRRKKYRTIKSQKFSIVSKEMKKKRDQEWGELNQLENDWNCFLLAKLRQPNRNFFSSGFNFLDVIT